MEIIRDCRGVWQDGLLQGVDDEDSQGLQWACGLWKGGLLQGGADGLVQNCDVGDNQGIQGACGKMVTSRVVMMGIGRDSRGLVARWSPLGW